MHYFHKLCIGGDPADRRLKARGAIKHRAQYEEAVEVGEHVLRLEVPDDDSKLPRMAVCTVAERRLSFHDPQLGLNRYDVRVGRSWFDGGRIGDGNGRFKEKFVSIATADRLNTLLTVLENRIPSVGVRAVIYRELVPDREYPGDMWRPRPGLKPGEAVDVLCALLPEAGLTDDDRDIIRGVDIADEVNGVFLTLTTAIGEHLGDPLEVMKSAGLIDEYYL